MPLLYKRGDKTESAFTVASKSILEHSKGVSLHLWKGFHKSCFYSEVYRYLVILDTEILLFIDNHSVSFC